LPRAGASLPCRCTCPSRAAGFTSRRRACRAAAGYVAVKINANFPENRARTGLPTIQGAVLLSDATDGTPLALLDSIEITIQRTGAATAVAAKYLARAESRTATICGCGEQGRIQLIALRHALHLRRVFAWDRDRKVADTYARTMSDELGIAVKAVTELRDGTLGSDVIVTCTSAREPFLHLEDVHPGTFIAAIGADNPEKNEIAAGLMAQAIVVADVLPQCAVMGDLHHAIRAGAMSLKDVHAELGDLVTGRKRGRGSPEEVTLFDATGTGVQDVAAAARAYQAARARGLGRVCELGGA
jgi:ornithine cyclodeaminase/alanine dehydrogenase-like protein (mu-crystallin family)